jgi:hypothetical protein
MNFNFNAMIIFFVVVFVKIVVKLTGSTGFCNQ